uniref:Ionotropic glutamate receptor L-glutamate and glycine-binding domain-containing protein n=1 Tax=Anopheles coluzzii TaxID=1518534 RepID=A0A6E8WB91_ANOCL
MLQKIVLFAVYCCFQFSLCALQLPFSHECNLSPTIDAIVQIQRHRYIPNFDAEVCIITTAVSTLGHTHPNVVPLLSSKNTVTFATHNHLIPMLLRKYANLVLLDATGWEQFPVKLLMKQFNENPCHFIDARFIVLVTRSCFVNDRPTIIKLFVQYGIVNYAIVPMPSNNTEPVHNISLYTENQFSRAKIYVPMNDLDHLQRLYPNKLLNLHRYHIRITVFSDFPYIILPSHGLRETGGIISHFFKDVGPNKLNLSYVFQEKRDGKAEATFNSPIMREHFQHEIDLREMGGMCMLCPVDTGRDFLTHLLKPFSYGIWIVLGAVYLVCQFLQHRYPAIFCYDLTLLTFFGGGGVEYRQAFAFRIALLILAMLLFFLSEAYNTKIISLMSLSKYYKRPETMAEFRATDYRIVLEAPDRKILGDLYPKVLSSRETARLHRKLGIRLYRHYCTIILCGDAWLIAMAQFQEEPFPMYVLREKAIEATQSMQFANNSPIAGTMKRYFGLYCDTGLWQRQMDRYNRIIVGLSLIWETFSEVIFYYEDLQCVWILVVVGWLISMIVFVGEVVWCRMHQSKQKPCRVVVLCRDALRHKCS